MLEANYEIRKSFIPLLKRRFLLSLQLRPEPHLGGEGLRMEQTDPAIEGS